ncbi:unnamed protein product [Phytophthora lilii]|uniref:Unnamed protein product n=1 Tax=Phytophthora lilii TaxID=2077276 RepID=A0A9W7CMP5_9STRA|nr:unnamed protein product [Phytophthora lilii]
MISSPPMNRVETNLHDLAAGGPSACSPADGTANALPLGTLPSGNIQGHTSIVDVVVEYPLQAAHTSREDFPQLTGSRNFDMWKARVTASLDGKHLLGFITKKDYNGVSDDEEDGDSSESEASETKVPRQSTKTPKPSTTSPAPKKTSPAVKKTPSPARRPGHPLRSARFHSAGRSVGLKRRSVCRRRPAVFAAWRRGPSIS